MQIWGGPWPEGLGLWSSLILSGSPAWAKEGGPPTSSTPAAGSPGDAPRHPQEPPPGALTSPLPIHTWHLKGPPPIRSSQAQSVHSRVEPEGRR